MGNKTKVRGIYGTSLVRLLLDNGFEIVEPSVEQSTRFKLDPTASLPELVIRDRDDRQGIVAHGTPELLDSITQILRASLTDVIVRGGTAATFRDFEFPSMSKSELDTIRRRTAMTVGRHHFFKACGGEISSFVDMAERRLSQGHPVDEIERVLANLVEPYLPYEGSVADVNHVKLGGTVLGLGQATILQSRDEEILYTRRIRNGGLYDGLGIERKPGDIAVTRTSPTGVYSETGYFSATGVFKGAYVNMGTPVELYPLKIRYVDLEVDISVLGDGTVTVLDDDLLDKEAERGTIGGALYNMIQEEVRKLTHTYASDFSELSNLHEYSKST